MISLENAICVKLRVWIYLSQILFYRCSLLQKKFVSQCRSAASSSFTCNKSLHFSPINEKKFIQKLGKCFMCKIKGLDLSFLDLILQVRQFAKKKVCPGGKALGKSKAHDFLHAINHSHFVQLFTEFVYIILG